MVQTSKFHELAVVRVVSLATPLRNYEGTSGISRPPQIGDIGTVVSVCSTAPDPDPTYIVESVNSAGHTVWLADFLASELTIA